MILQPLKDDPLRLEYPEVDVETLGLHGFEQLPERAEIPKVFGVTNPWCKWAQDGFFEGIKVSDWEFEPSVDAPAREVLRVAWLLLQNRDIEHMHKVALVGWCLASWFRRISAVDGSLTIGEDDAQGRDR